MESSAIQGNIQRQFLGWHYNMNPNCIWKISSSMSVLFFVSRIFDTMYLTNNGINQINTSTCFWQQLQEFKLFLLYLQLQRENSYNEGISYQWEPCYHNYNCTLTSVNTNFVLMDTNHISKENQRTHFSSLEYLWYKWTKILNSIMKRILYLILTPESKQYLFPNQS